MHEQSTFAAFPGTSAASCAPGPSGRSVPALLRAPITLDSSVLQILTCSQLRIRRRFLRRPTRPLESGIESQLPVQKRPAIECARARSPAQAQARELRLSLRINVRLGGHIGDAWGVRNARAWAPLHSGLFAEPKDQAPGCRPPSVRPIRCCHLNPPSSSLGRGRGRGTIRSQSRFMPSHARTIEPLNRRYHRAGEFQREQR